MGFWGIEVKPGKTHPYHSDNVQGRLYVTQATLGLGSSTERCILQCSVGHKSQIFLCSLLPDRIESCSLNLEFKDELVAFSVIGTRSIHLSGYFVSDEEGDYLRDENESDSGEDIADTETDESSEYDYDDEFDDHFVVDDNDDDDDLEMSLPSPVPKSGVVIEEITDNDKLVNGDGQCNQQNTKNPSHDHVGHGQQQMVVSCGTGVSVLESEDEDGFPISISQKSEVRDQKQQDELNKKRTTKETKKKKARDYDGDASAKKRKVTSTGPDDQPESRLKKKKEKKKQKEKGKDIKTDEIDNDQANEIAKDKIQPEEVTKQDFSDRNNHDTRGMDVDGVPGESSSDKKRKKKKNKKKIQDPGVGEKDGTATSVGNETQSLLEPVEKESAAKSSHIRTFANGLVIEELAMGKPDGKRASPGNRVRVRYIGKLLKTGKLFDSNVGRKPFEFRLGVGQVIKGWDVGVNGMRLGDKRRLIIPPSMGYGDKPVGGKIPPNSWLVFDVELVNVR